MVTVGHALGGPRLGRTSVNAAIEPYPVGSSDDRHGPDWARGTIRHGGPTAPFGAPLASWWQRVGAAVLDSVVTGIPLGILNIVVNRTLGTDHVVVTGDRAHFVHSLEGAPHVILILLFAVLVGGYMTHYNGSGNGQTIGNRAPGIAVRDVDTGEVIGLRRAAIRWAVRAVLYLCFVLPGIVNDLFPLWDPKRQTLADKAARSVMIRLR
jgi:uncharacterized RDD family membrane protein YckC